MNRRLSFLALSALLLGCASEPPQPPAPPPPTVVELQIEADAQLNPDASGLTSPVMLRIYQLKEASNFNGADFFALLEKEQPTLAGTLAHKQEMLVKMGESKKIILKPDNDSHVIGFFASFRQLDTAQWRASAEIVANQTQQITLKLKDNRLSVEKAR